VELNDIFLILGIFLPVFFVAIWQLNRVNPTRKGLKAGDNSIKEMYNTYNQQVQDVLKVKDKQISSLSAKLRTYDEDTEQEQPEITDLVKNPEIQKLLQAKGINPALLDNPIIQKYIKKYTKGMSIEQVLEIANQFGLLKGTKQPQGDPLSQSQEYNPNWA